MKIEKIVYVVKRFLLMIVLAPAMLINLFLVFSIFNPNKVLILENEGYSSLINTLVGIGSWIYIIKAQKYFDDYKKWKEEAIYQRQLNKGIDNRYTEELADVRREEYLDF